MSRLIDEEHWDQKAQKLEADIADAVEKYTRPMARFPLIATQIKEANGTLNQMHDFGSLKKARGRLAKNNNLQHSYPTHSRQPRQFGGENRQSRFSSNRYDVVPPVRRPTYRNRTTVAGVADEDSWGEVSEDSDAEEHIPLRRPHKKSTFPLPRMSFGKVPVEKPEYLGYKAFAPKPVKKYQPRYRSKRQPDVIHTLDSPPRPEYSHTDHHFSTVVPHIRVSSPTPPDGYTVDPNLPYIQVQRAQSPLEYDHTFEQSVIDAATVKFSSDPSYAQNYTENFIEDELRDQIIPDLLIEVLSERYLQKSDGSIPVGNRDLGWPAHSLPPGYRPPLEAHHIKQPRSLHEQAHISKHVTDDLIDDVIDSELQNIVRDTCAQQVSDYITEDEYERNINKLIDEETRLVVNSMLDEVKRESLEEVILDDDVTLPVLNSLAEEIAVETMQQQDDERKRHLADDIGRVGGDKLLDGVILDYLLTQLVSQQQAISESLISQYCMDGMIIDVLLRKLGEIEEAKSRVLDIKPVRRYHERVTTDVALDLLLNELCLNLDEDMKDYDEYESGLVDYLAVSGLLDSDQPHRPASQLNIQDLSNPPTPHRAKAHGDW